MKLKVSDDNFQHLVLKIISGSDGPAILRVLAEQTGARLLLLSYDFRTIVELGLSVSEEKCMQMKQAIREILVTHPNEVLTREPGPYPIASLGMNFFIIQSFERVHGFIVTDHIFDDAFSEPESTDNELLYFRQAVQAMALRFLYIHATEQVERRYQSGFLQDLVLGRFRDDNHARLRGKTIGIDLDEPQHFYLLDLQLNAARHEPSEVWIKTHSWDTANLYTEYVDDVDQVCRLLSIHSWVAPTKDGIAIVIPKKQDFDSSKFADRFIREFRKRCPNVHVWLAVTSPIQRPTEMPLRYQEARTALRLGRRLFPEKNIISYEEMGAYRALADLGDNAVQFYKEQLASLEEYDQKGSANLLETLRCFFASNLSRTECAQNMYVHTNTIAYRLKKIEELTGMSLKDFQHCFHLQLALIIKDLTEVNDVN